MRTPAPDALAQRHPLPERTRLRKTRRSSDSKRMPWGARRSPGGGVVGLELVEDTPEELAGEGAEVADGEDVR
eukprot:2129801-Alexandrium_andersonii.AAC.1